ncbi:MAG: OmpA family protein [Magnetococcales bacterium]|nr:OmpA family protein [Magnetococcales bacterium]
MSVAKTSLPLKSWVSPEVAVVGHTDTVGAEDANHRLALDRAKMVHGLLLGIGIPASAIEVTSHGEKNLLVQTADELPEPRNRRVEVSIR